MTDLSSRHHDPPDPPRSSRIALQTARRSFDRRWPEHRRARLPGRRRLRELRTGWRPILARLRPSAVRAAVAGPAPDTGRLVGLLLVRNEDDILADTLAVATQWFDRILVLDGTTDPDRRRRTDAIYASCPEVVYVARDADVATDGAVRDGARQHLLDEARRRYGVDRWIGLLHADEFLDQDPRPMLAAHRPLLDPTIRVRLVHAFLHTSDQPHWEADPAAWDSTPIRERIRHVMWPGVPETRFFFDRGTRDYVVDHHSKTVPTSFRAGPIEHGYTIVQYNERSPRQAVERGVSRDSTGWQTEHYARFLADVPDVFVASLDSPAAPFAPEFVGDPDGPFRVGHLDDLPAGPLPADLGAVRPPTPLADLCTTPSRRDALAWAVATRAAHPREDHPLVDYTARLVGSRRLTDAQRRRVAAEFAHRIAERARRGDSATANAVPSDEDDGPSGQ